MAQRGVTPQAPASYCQGTELRTVVEHAVLAWALGRVTVEVSDVGATALRLRAGVAMVMAAFSGKRRSWRSTTPAAMMI